MKIIEIWSSVEMTITMTASSHGMEIGSYPSMQEPNENLVRVIKGALTIEKYLKRIISYHFFGREETNVKEFESRILDTDWCSYGNKCRLAVELLSAKGFLEGKAKSDLDQAVRRVGDWRNFFAHGSFKTVEDRVFLCYYKNKPIEEELTDERLTEIETLLNDTYSKLVEIHNKQTDKPKIQTIL